MKRAAFVLLALIGILAGCVRITQTFGPGAPGAVTTPQQQAAAAPRAGGTGVLDVSWTAPTTNTDGTPLNDLASYNVYYAASPTNPCPTGGTKQNVPSQTTTPPANTTVSTTLQNLTVGTVYDVAVTAVDTSNNESACSAGASATARTNPTPVTNTLTALKTGSGSGTITSNPAGLSCGSTCAASFAATTTVTVSAVPATGSVFQGWSGDCTADPCNLAMTANHTVTGAFALTHVMNVTMSGTGSGTVSSSPTGINCSTGKCSASYPDSTSVLLTPTPNSGSMFTGWTGDCTGTTVCSLAMAQDRNVTATFAPAYSLTLTNASTNGGTGTVSSADGKILNSGGTSTYLYAPGIPVNLTATPSGTSTFAGWTGACSGTATGCTVIMNSNVSATATFAGTAPAGADFTLRVTNGGQWSGIQHAEAIPTAGTTSTGVNFSLLNAAGTTVFSNAEGGAPWCLAGDGPGQGGDPCADFDTTKYPNGNYTLSAAMSYSSGSGGTLTKTAAITIQNGVTPPPTSALTVTKAGQGNGTVTSSPAGISCGTTCTATFTTGTSVTLTAAVGSGSTFGGWSGGCTGTATTCSVSMTAAKSVTATFNVAPPLTYNLSVTKAGTGTGTVTSSPAGINCGTACSASYNAGTSVTLTAAPATGSTFTGWSGACTGTAACTVTMSAAQAVTATFTLVPPPPSKNGTIQNLQPSFSTTPMATRSGPPVKMPPKSPPKAPK